MADLIMCPGCGQTSMVDPTAGGRIACPACGKSLTKLLRPDPPPPTSDPFAVAADDGVADDGVADAARLLVPRPAVPRHGRRWPAGVGIVLGVLVVGGCVAGVAVALLLQRPATPPSATAVGQPDADDAWVVGHRPEFFRLKADAEALVLSGDLAGGHERYRQLTLLAGQHAVRDPVVVDLLRDAQIGQERIYGMLLAKQEVAMGRATPAGAGGGAAGDVVTPPANAVAPTVAAVTADPPLTPTTAPVLPTPPALTPAVPLAVVLPGRAADQRVGASLDRGVDSLCGHFRGGQLVDGLPSTGTLHQGLDALCVYALLHAAEASRDPRLNPKGPFLSQLIDQLKAFPLDADPNRPATPVVYARSLRAAALAVFNRPDDRKALQADVAWLVRAQTQGGYTYDDRYASGSTGATVPPVDPSTGLGSVPPNDPSRGGSNGPPQMRTDIVGGGGKQRTRSVYVPAAPAHTLIDKCVPGRGHIINVPASPGHYENQPDSPPPPGPRAVQVPVTPPPPRDNSSLGGPLDSDTPPPGPPPGPGGSLAGPVPWDNSNSQYGLLGVWAGAEAGVEVPQAYWKTVESHWLACELRDGTWFYSDTDTHPRLSMTCAGVASLLVTHEWLDPAALGTRVGRVPYSPALTAGLGWLEAGDHVLGVVSPETFYLGYSAYGIERCGLASGFKFFGTHDWFREVSDQLLPYQGANGAWGRNDGMDTLVNTAYMVLFLSRGRHPVLMNKLRMDPYWDNRPRDLANLTQFASRQLERPFNWQVVSFARPWSDWMDAPVLYVASHVPPKLSAEDEAKLKAYADAGGVIFTHADGNSASFTRWAEDLSRRLWPELGGLQPLGKDHELYDVVFHLKARPKLSAVSNGARLLMVHSPTDLSPMWQERVTKSGRDTFGLGVNLFVWAAGKGTFRNRLDTPFIPDPPPSSAPAVSVARLRYAGGWDPEPYAWTRFAHYCQWTTGTPVTATPVDLSALKPGQAAVAALTGTAAVTFTDADVAAVRAYVTAGGTLLVDACGGSHPFADSAEGLLGRAFPGVPLQPLADTDPLVRGSSAGLDDLTRPAVRAYAAEKIPVPVGGKGPPLRGLVAGTGRVVYSPIDLTTGLLDTNPWGLVGYAPAYAQAAVKNVVLTAAAK